MALSGPQVIGENAQSGKRNYYCDLCCKMCESANSLAGHFTGNKHKHKLKLIKPQEQNDASRLSVFLKAHMKEEPIVGLEYVIERKEEDYSYTYSCQLCGLLICNLQIIVSHLVNPSHATCYIKKHFSILFPKCIKVRTKRGIAKSVRDVAVMILEGQGHKKEIQVVLPDSDGKMREASEDIPPSKPESDGKMREASKDTPPSKPESDGKMREASEDIPPSKPESDGKMREASEDTPPSKPESDGKMREASKDTPPSKPESDGKIREASKDTPPSKPESDGKMREASKDTPLSKPKSGNISELKLSPLPIKESREIYRYNKLFQKYISNDPPLAKRSRRSPGGDQDVLPSTAHTSKHGSSHYNKSHAIRRNCTATQELEFRTNDEFFEYFANFVISDDEDAVFIRTIAQNCIKALTSFLEEDAERQKTGHRPEAPLEDTSRTAQVIPGILENETQSHLSNSETSLLKDHSNPPSDPIPKNEATNVFFNSIKVVINPRKKNPARQRHNELW